MAFPFDGQYETFQHYGTNAERLAFTPNPSTATGVQPIYIWYATDTGLTWVYDTSWHAVSGPGGGVPATVQGDLLYASGTNTLAALAKNATATRYLSNTGTTNNPAWAQVALATGVSGILPVANGGTGSATGAAILVASSTLTDAQIKALPTTPITLIAAPSAGTRVKVISASLSSQLTTGYTNFNATYAACAIYWLGDFTHWATVGLVDDATYAGATRFSSFFGIASSGMVDLGPYVDTPSDGAAGVLWTLPDVKDTSTVSGIALAIKIDNNGTGNLTAGNGANVLKVTVYYTLETV